MRGQVLETETARLLPPGVFKLGSAFEFQTSSEGTERALPLLVEYGLAKDLEIAVEPVVYTAIRPKVGRSATDVGDLEATLTYRFLGETSNRPALAAAGEVKFPTAKNTLVGTGQTDYTGYLIASKQFGLFDVHAHVGYAVLGNPPGQKLDNVFQGALAAVYRPTPRFEYFGEVLGTTGSAAEGDTATSNAVVPEAPSGEVVETLGIGWSPERARGALFFFSVSHDNQNAIQFRVGLTLNFPR